jgi:SpoVK/Ycf46/Vps4 family AAA+-type ATPase
LRQWFGESENKLADIFDACSEMGGAIIFIDEVDAPGCNNL